MSKVYTFFYKILCVSMFFFYLAGISHGFDLIITDPYDWIIPNFDSIISNMQITEVTNDSKNDYFPSLKNGYAVWYKNGVGVYMWDTSKPVSTATKIIDLSDLSSTNLGVFRFSELESLSSFGDKVAILGNFNFTLDLGFTRSTVSTDVVGLWDGNDITWLNEQTKDPSLYDENVAYAKYDGKDYEIIIQKGIYKAQITSNSYNDTKPSLFGDTVAWQGWDGEDWEIYYWDGDKTHQITNNGNNDYNPSLFDSSIAWQGYDGTDWEIYLWNGTQVVQITSNDSNDINPSLSQGKVAWQGWDGHDYEIYYWDGTQIIQVTNNSGNDTNPSLDNGAILWQHHDASDWEIFYAEVDVPQKPSVSVLNAENVTFTSAVLKGNVNPNGQPTTYHFEWGTSTNYGAVTPDRDAGSARGNIVVEETIANLTPGTTYHYRLVAVNPTGTSTSADKTFTTPAITVTAPTVTTGHAAEVTARTATLTGTVNPQGAETKYRFEYGTDTAYAMSTPWFAAGNGTTDISVNATVNNLQPSTTYHFRIVAENAGGTVEGNDETFTTLTVTDPMEETRSRFTGWWYDSTAPGTGMAIEIQESNKLFLAWFVYDENGRTTWYASGGELQNETTYVGTLWKYSGWAWGQEQYSPPVGEIAGSITLVFYKGRNDMVNFTAVVGDKIVNGSFTSFMKDFAPGLKDPRNITGWWYDPDYDGMGFYMDARGGKMAMVWYNYREDHSPRWWTSTNTFSSTSTIYMGTLDGWRNGQCVGCPFTSPPERIQAEGGTININFIGPNRADATVGNTVLNLQRFVIP